MDNAEVAENILKLHALRAKINMQNILKHMHLSSRSRDAKVVKKIFGDWVALGWLVGGEDKGYVINKSGNTDTLFLISSGRKN